MLARVLEEEGLTTTTIALIKEHAERVKPPRALFVPFPFGVTLGRTNDPEFQHKVIAAALDLLSSNDVPVLAEFPEEGQGPARLLQASAARGNGVQANGNAADEVTALRAYYERWVEENGGRTSVGLSGIPQRRFRGMIRFLESYSRGEDTDLEERPTEMSVPQFIRYCIDDLKAFYYEARMNQRPDAGENDLHQWFWGETAGGQLVVQIADRLNASEDPVLKHVAFGLAR